MTHLRNTPAKSPYPNIQFVAVHTPDPEECRRTALEDRAYYDDLYDRYDDYGQDD